MDKKIFLISTNQVPLWNALVTKMNYQTAESKYISISFSFPEWLFTLFGHKHTKMDYEEGEGGTVYCWQNLFVLKEIGTILILIFSASSESSSNMCTNSYHKLRLNISPVISSYRPFCASFRVMKISAKYDFYWSVSCLKFLNNVTSFTMLKWKARFVIFKALCKAMSRRRHFDNKHLDPNLSA